MGESDDARLARVLQELGAERQRSAEHQAQAQHAPEWLMSLPPWAKVAWLLGPTTIIALGLVYVGARNIPDIRLELEGLRKDMQGVQIATVDLKNEIHSLNNTIAWLCSGLQKDEESRKGCFGK